jgi:hypothetical protein
MCRWASATASSGNVESTSGRTADVSTSFQNASWSYSLALRSPTSRWLIV